MLFYVSRSVLVRPNLKSKKIFGVLFGRWLAEKQKGNVWVATTLQESGGNSKDAMDLKEFT